MIMIKGEVKSIANGTTQEIPKGPYYVLPINTSSTITKVVVISPPLDQSAAEAETPLIKSIAESVYLVK